MAGIALVPYRTFAPATALAAVPWAAGYYAIGVVAAEPWHALLGLVAAHGRLAAAAVITAAATIAAITVADRRRRTPR